MKGNSNPGRAHTMATKATSPREQVLAKMLAIIQSNPGIRPSELNRRLNMKESDALRDTLVRRGLVRKVKQGAATHLYAK
jgi:hypothetical protein